MAIEHRNISDAERHEPKGASTANAGEVLTSNGDTTTEFRKPVTIGWWNLNDLATASSAISLASAGTFYQLTNDTLGPATITTYALPNVTQIWDTDTDYFDFTELDVGDVVDIRVDIEFTTTTTNTAITLELELATGSGSEISVPIVNLLDVKTAGTYQRIIPIPMFIGSTLVKNNPAQLKMKADKTGVTVKVNGWFVNVTKRNSD